MTDDHARPIRLVRPGELPAGAEEPVRSIVAKLHAGRSGRFYVGMAISVAIPSLMLATFSMMKGGPQGGYLTLVVVGVACAVMVAGALIVSGIMRGRWLVELREQCLHHNLCMQCGYSLAGLAPEPDACTICPECGAAWRMPPSRTEAALP